MFHEQTSDVKFAPVRVFLVMYMYTRIVIVGLQPTGLASADVTAKRLKRDAWKRIATGKTGSKQR